MFMTHIACFTMSNNPRSRKQTINVIYIKNSTNENKNINRALAYFLSFLGKREKINLFKKPKFITLK